MERKSYPGGKGSCGTYQRIINNMPPHQVYIEPFIGGGSVFKNKRPANDSIIVDSDAAVISEWQDNENATVICGDAIQFLRNYNWKGEELIYCDPPYVMESRTGGKLYNHEFSDDQHVELLDLITTLPCNVMISGYHSKLYAAKLKTWHLTTFGSMTRRGLALEHLWCNFQSPTKLHDYQYLGDGYRERERIKKKVNRWTDKLENMPKLERQAIMAAMQSAGF
ncbi:MAG: DNA adenine methylase [Gammaproteobacteria bacterium]|nr:DNA adenine methylase [Gammaproteobacteria bacterium]